MLVRPHHLNTEDEMEAQSQVTENRAANNRRRRRRFNA